MRTIDITLSASLIGLYIAAKIISAVSPIKITGLMMSALFGLFWGYFSFKQNLMFSSIRLIGNVFTSIGKVYNIEQVVSLEWDWGLRFIEYLNTTLGVALDGIDYLGMKELSRLTTISNMFILYVSLAIAYCYVWPYLFYKYFKYVEIFRRLPEP